MTITPRDGEPVTYTSYEDLEKDFVSGKVRGGWLVAPCCGVVLKDARAVRGVEKGYMIKYGGVARCRIIEEATMETRLLRGYGGVFQS